MVLNSRTLEILSTTYNSWNAVTIDLTSRDDYQNLTLDNFILIATGTYFTNMAGRSDHTSDLDLTATSYSDGILNIKSSYMSNASSNWGAAVSYQVAIQK